MKKSLIISLGLLFLSTPAFACRNQVPESEADRYMAAAPNGVPGLYSCEEKPLEECICFDGLISWEVAEKQDVFVDGSPIYSMNCPKSTEGCEPIGYEQIKAGRKIGNSSEKLAAYMEKKISDDAMEKDIKIAQDEARKGQRLIALFRVLNKRKNLSKAQKKQLLGDAKIQAILNSLSVGSLPEAIDMIDALVPDGVIITDNDKQTILREANK